MPALDLRKFDKRARGFLNTIRDDLNFQVNQVRIFGKPLLTKSIKKALFKERRLRHTIPAVDKFTFKSNTIRDPVVGRGYGVKFIRRPQTFKLRMIVTKRNSTARVFWSLAVARGGRKALTRAMLGNRFNAFGVRFRTGDLRGRSAADVERLKDGGNPFLGAGSDRILVPLNNVGPVRPYYDWIFHSESIASMEMKKFLKRLEARGSRR
jgi:hypothetical protein